LKLTKYGSERIGLEITGKPKNREPEIVTVDFPGGQVEVTRAKDGEDADYWVHVKVHHPKNSMRYPDDGYENGKVTIHGKGVVTETKLDDPELHHLAIRVTRVPK